MVKNSTKILTYLWKLCLVQLKFYVEFYAFPLQVFEFQQEFYEECFEFPYDVCLFRWKVYVEFLVFQQEEISVPNFEVF